MTPARSARAAGSSLTAFLGVLLISAVAAAGVTTGALILADRIGRPPIALGPAALPTIVVQVDGGVATPGTYRLAPGARLHDAVQAAGGLRPDADVGALNMAARVGDGEAITVPVAGEADATAPAAAPATAGAPAPINVNTATVEELDTLPGIGPVIGERIVTWREENGLFRSVDDLTSVDGISDNLLETLRPHVTVDD